MPKMHRNTFGDRAPPDPLGELKRSPSHSRGVLLLRGGAFQLTVAQPHWNIRLNENVEFPIVSTFF